MTRSRKELLPGTLDLLVLKVLSAGKEHGYGIARRIQSASGDVLRVEEGSLYPALHRLERKGWIRAEWGQSEAKRRAKFYALTRSGRRRLASETASWEALSQAVGRVLDTPALEG